MEPILQLPETPRPSCKVIYGDCQQILQDYAESVDVIITSPPYADARKKHYDSIHPDQYCQWFLSFHDHFFQVLKPAGSFVINIKDKVVGGVRHRYVWQTIEALCNLGWYAIDDYIWHKSNPMPGRWPNRLSDGWEYCFHLAKSKRPFFHPDGVRKPIGHWAETRLTHLTDTDQSRQNSANHSGFGRNMSKWVGKDQVFPCNVLEMPLVGKNMGHPAVFPVSLPAFFIKLLCPENGVVLDPFAGSGTTGIAAAQLNRPAILIENNLDYCQVSYQRLQQEGIPCKAVGFSPTSCINE